MSNLMNLPNPPVFSDVDQHRSHIKQRLAAAFRLFSKFGFDEGVAGHITARDPEFPNTFWMNPFGCHFSQVCVSNLIQVDETGSVINGNGQINLAGFSIHNAVHNARPDVMAAAHTHSIYGRAWSVFGRRLDIVTQDACAFFNDHSVYHDFGGVAVELEEGQRIAKALGNNKAAILQNHGLLTVGSTVDAAAWWFITMERSCQVQLMIESASHNRMKQRISSEVAEQSYSIMGSEWQGWFSFQPLYDRIIKEQPDCLT